MSESFRHLWGRTGDATPPTPDPRERGEAERAESDGAVSRAYPPVVLRDGPFTVLLTVEQPDEEHLRGYWVAHFIDADTHKRAIKFAPLAHHETREGALAHLACAIYNGLMEDAPAPSEAVAWGIWHYNGDLVGLKRTKDEAERWCEGSATYGPPRPLYTHPAPAREVTVTEAMVRDALNAAWNGYNYEDDIVAKHLTAALTPDAEGGR